MVCIGRGDGVAGWIILYPKVENPWAPSSGPSSKLLLYSGTTGVETPDSEMSNPLVAPQKWHSEQGDPLSP